MKILFVNIQRRSVNAPVHRMFINVVQATNSSPSLIIHVNLDETTPRWFPSRKSKATKRTETRYTLITP